MKKALLVLPFLALAAVMPPAVCANERLTPHKSMRRLQTPARLKSSATTALAFESAQPTGNDHYTYFFERQDRDRAIPDSTTIEYSADMRQADGITETESSLQ